MQPVIPQVYVDLDGVLADFDSHYERAFGVRPDKVADNVDWALVNGSRDFYAGIPPMPDALDLWDFVSRLKTRPIVLTGVPKLVPIAADNKRRWVDQHLGAATQVICCRSADKFRHAKAGDILVDDWEKYKHRWLRVGGRWITHTSAENSIQQLLDMGIGI